MIEFKEGSIPQQRLTTLTAYISDIELMVHSRSLVKNIIHELVKQSVMLHRIDIENMVTEYILSSGIKEYVQTKLREEIDNAIRDEVAEIIHRDKE